MHEYGSLKIDSIHILEPYALAPDIINMLDTWYITKGLIFYLFVYNI